MHGLPAVGAGDLLDKRANTSSPVSRLVSALGEDLDGHGLTFDFTQNQHELDEARG